MRRTVDRLGVQHRLDQLATHILVDVARRARTHVVVNTAKPALKESSGRRAYRGLVQMQVANDRSVGLTIASCS